MALKVFAVAFDLLFMTQISGVLQCIYFVTHTKSTCENEDFYRGRRKTVSSYKMKGNYKMRLIILHILVVVIYINLVFGFQQH